MMPLLTSVYPGDRVLEVLLVVVLGVTVLSIAAWLIARRLPGRAALRHTALLSALIGCLAFPAAAWFSSVAGLRLVCLPILKSDSMESNTVVPPNASGPAAMTACACPVSPAGPAGQIASPPADKANDASRLECCPDAAASPAVAMSPGNPPAALGFFRSIAAAIMLVWSGGFLLMSARLARNCLRVMLVRRGSEEVTDKRLRLILDKVAVRLRMRRVPLLLASSRITAPLAVGLGRPAVILPRRLLGLLGNDEAQDILAHEMAHLARGDQRIVLLEALAAAIYWPIVPVHAANRELRRAREEACDNFVLADRAAARYGETLLHIAELLTATRQMPGAVGIFDGPGELERRIAGMLDPRRSTATKVRRLTAGAVWLLLISLAAIIATTRFAASAPPPSTTESAPPPAAAIPAAAAPASKTSALAEKPLPAAAGDAKSAGHFEGLVTGPDGRPMAGAQIYMIRFYGEPTGRRPLRAEMPKSLGPLRAETDAEGRFSFDAVDMTYSGGARRREGVIVATKKDYAPEWFHTWGNDHQGLMEYWDPVEGDHVNLRLAEDDVSVHGRLLDGDGRPLAGAAVRLTSLMIPKGRDLTMHLARWSKASEMSRFLTRVPDYEREVYSPHIDLVPGLPREVKTDADGRFAMSGLGRDRLAELSVTAPGVADTTITVMTRNAPDTGTFLDPSGKPTEIIHGAMFTMKLDRAAGK